MLEKKYFCIIFTTCNQFASYLFLFESLKAKPYVVGNQKYNKQTNKEEKRVNRCAL